VCADASLWLPCSSFFGLVWYHNQALNPTAGSAHECYPVALQFITRRNATRTILWPAPAAWSGFSLQSHLPSFQLTTINERIRALKIIALYMLSYQQVKPRLW